MGCLDGCSESKTKKVGHRGNRGQGTEMGPIPRWRKRRNNDKMIDLGGNYTDSR